MLSTRGPDLTRNCSWRMIIMEDRICIKSIYNPNYTNQNYHFYYHPFTTRWQLTTAVNTPHQPIQHSMHTLHTSLLVMGSMEADKRAWWTSETCGDECCPFRKALPLEHDRWKLDLKLIYLVNHHTSTHSGWWTRTEKNILLHIHIPHISPYLHILHCSLIIAHSKMVSTSLVYASNITSKLPTTHINAWNPRCINSGFFFIHCEALKYLGGGLVQVHTYVMMIT